jgi:hypothetical protein
MAFPGYITAYTQAELEALFGRLLPPGYLEPLKSPGPGYEILQAFAALFKKISDSVAVLGRQGYIISAEGAAYATGTVELYRAAPHPSLLTVVVKQGTVVSCRASGRRFTVDADVTFPGASVGPFTVGVTALFPDYNYNVPGQVTTADGTILPGDIDTVVTLVEDPDYGDPTIQVRQTTLATTGGVDGSLDVQGKDRGLPRIGVEPDETYRARIRAVPDNISPDAFVRAVRIFMLPYGAQAQIIETWDIDYQTCYDGPDTTYPNSNYDPNLFCYDDPRSPVPFRNRYMDEVDYRGGVIVVVPNLPAIADVGMAYDDVAMNPVDFHTTLGRRAATAYDVTSALTTAELAGGYDGFDLQKQAVYKGLYNLLQNIKAAGISVAVELAGN